MQAAEGVAKPARKCCAAARSSADFAVRFSGDGEEGLKLLQKAKKATGLAIITEVMSDRDVDLVAKYADVMQVGAEHAELHAAEGAREMRAAGAAEARVEQHGERIADVRGIHHGTRKSRRDFV